MGAPDLVRGSSLLEQVAAPVKYVAHRYFEP